MMLFNSVGRPPLAIVWLVNKAVSVNMLDFGTFFVVSQHIFKHNVHLINSEIMLQYFPFSSLDYRVKTLLSA